MGNVIESFAVQGWERGIIFPVYGEPTGRLGDFPHDGVAVFRLHEGKYLRGRDILPPVSRGGRLFPVVSRAFL